ncbi:unnamed protein product [Parnassius mnemosyne]|uniref:Reverse transcriptase domain-containing protein n=1 Tax=Parnassius mnemosyne TaxID=213953 RepID=A0AAV1MC92_9NEOP
MLIALQFATMFATLKLCTANCNNLTINTNYDSILREKYAKLFSSELGTFNKFKIHLKLKSDAELKFFKPRPVPLALKPKVEKELNRLLDLGILEKVNHSRVATPIVPVLRSDGDIRICGDFSVTLNKVLFMDNYPLPRIEDLFAKLHGGEQFSKLDLSRAYNQLVLDDTKELTCINTHKGLFRYTRLVFGLCSAPSIFQQTMENLLAGIEGTGIFLDDILVTGPTKAVHMERLEQVLSRLQDAGLRLKSEKCELFKDSVEYLGFIIDKTGLRKSKQKVDAILKCCRPKNVSELKNSRHCTTGFSPAQLMLGRSLRCRLDLLSVTTESLLLSSTSAVKKNVLSQQISQCKQYGGRRTTSFAIDDKVLVKCFYNNGSKHVWKLGRIVKKVGSRMYVVKIEKSCKSLKKHIDHLIAYKGNCTLQDDVNTDISYTDNDVIDYYTPSGTARDTAKEQNVQNTLQCTHSMNDSSSSGLLPPELELGEERIVSVGPSDTVSAVGNVLTDSALPESVSVQATSNQAVTEHSRGVRSTRNKNPIYKV